MALGRMWKVDILNSLENENSCQSVYACDQAKYLVNSLQ